MQKEQKDLIRRAFIELQEGERELPIERLLNNYAGLLSGIRNIPIPAVNRVQQASIEFQKEAYRAYVNMFIEEYMDTLEKIMENAETVEEVVDDTVNE